jgi:hypothetical protein
LSPSFPDKPSLEKLYDNLEFERAVQSYLLAPPAVSLTGMRAGLASFGPANSTLLITAQSRSLFLTANDNTVYSTTVGVEIHAMGMIAFGTAPFAQGVWRSQRSGTCRLASLEAGRLFHATR